MARPNVIVIMSDQMKATSSHLYGNPFCETPSLARLSAEGVRFEHACTPHPLCVPARVSLWTGQYPHSHGARRNETFMPGDAVHAFKLWKAEGFHLGLIGKNHCFAEAKDLALFDTWCEMGHGGRPAEARTRGMDWVRPVAAIDAAHATRRQMPTVSPRFAYAASDWPEEDYGTAVIAAQAARFLEERRREPFVLWVSFPDPHEPYETPRRYWEMMADRVEAPPWRADEFTHAPERNRVIHAMMGIEEDPVEDVEGMLSAYYGNVRFVDDGVGRILDALDGLGLRENTIVVFCADHGDFSGEHGMQCKGGVFYDALTRIPLIVSWPGQVTQGAVDTSMANLVDVAPTLLHLQGLTIPASMHGQPLPTVTDATPRDAAFSEYGAGGPPFTMDHLRALPQPWGRRALMRSLRWREAEGRRKMVRTRAWKYVHDPAECTSSRGDMDELYDLRADPWEQHNRIDDPGCRDVLADMRLRLADWSILTEDARPVPLPGSWYYTLEADA
jgi:arylsulfatase A-like enzyme